MYAVVATGGKQYKVAVGDTLKVEKLEGDSGKKIVFDQVLLVGGKEGLKIGTPVLKGAAVEAEILDQTQNKKLILIKKKRRKGYRKKQGHRQLQTILKINKIFA